MKCHFKTQQILLSVFPLLIVEEATEVDYGRN